MADQTHALLRGAAQMLELCDVIEREEREMRSCHGNRKAAFELWYAQECELLEQETQRLESATSSMAKATADEIAERYEAMALSIEERYTKFGAKIGARYAAAMC
jgi:phage host-nuclease inhibitor protein Gam